MFRRTVAMTVVLVGCTAGALAFASDLSRVGRALADRVSMVRGYTPVPRSADRHHGAADSLLETSRDSLAGEYCRFPPKGQAPKSYSGSSSAINSRAFEPDSMLLNGQSMVPRSDSGICVGEPARVPQLPRAPVFP
jgi:hypothetical protein